MGLIDDFSYVKTAWVFAQTGHFLYNGWATAMLGAQVLWAEPFIKLLGYTFFATRVSTVVLAMLCVWLTHAVFCRTGLNRSHALIGTLTLALSPLFLPLAVTFMTDISGLFAIVVCIYCCLRALESVSARTAILWLILCTIVGLLGGTTRQIAWLPVLVLVPTAAWMLRRQRSVLVAGVVLWLAGAASIAGCMLWFKHQPLIISEGVVQGAFHLRSLRELAGSLLAAALCLAFVMLPELALAFPLVRRLRPKVLAILFVGSCLATEICKFITHHQYEKGLLPWTGDILDRIGLLDFPNAWFIGVSPETFSTTDRLIGSIVVIFMLIASGYVFYKSTSVWRGSPIRPSWRTLIQLLGPFTAAYVTLLMPRGVWSMVIDRYLLPLMVIALILLLRLHQERVSSRLPIAGWLVLGILSIFTITLTHDWIASHKARVAAVHRLEANNIPVWKIEAGYEFDGMTQIDLAGAVYDPRTRYPVGHEIQPRPTTALSPECPPDILNEHTPAIHPQYFLAYQQLPCFRPSTFGDVPYSTWLPPYHRSILILVAR